MKIKIVKSFNLNYDNFKAGVYADIKENLRPILGNKFYKDLNSERNMLLADLIVKYISVVDDNLAQYIKISKKSEIYRYGVARDDVSYEIWCRNCKKCQIWFCMLMGLQQYAESHLNEKYLNVVNVAAEKAKRNMITKYNKFYKSVKVYESFDEYHASLPWNN